MSEAKIIGWKPWGSQGPRCRCWDMGDSQNHDSTTRLNLHMHPLNESCIRRYLENHFEKKGQTRYGNLQVKKDQAVTKTLRARQITCQNDWKKSSGVCHRCENLLIKFMTAKCWESSWVCRSATWKVAQANTGMCETYGTLAEELMQSLECKIVAIERSAGADPCHRESLESSLG